MHLKFNLKLKTFTLNLSVCFNHLKKDNRQKLPFSFPFAKFMGKSWKKKIFIFGRGRLMYR